MELNEHIISEESQSDEALVSAAQGNDTNAWTELVYRYLPNIRQKAGSYTNSSADRDDLIQEGLIGLLNAVNTYNSDKGASFKTYCYVCVQNKMLTELERRKSSKQQALQNYLPLEDLTPAVNGDGEDPFSIVAAQEDHDQRMAKAKTLLSDLEQETLSLYLSGLSYEEMAAQLKLSTKAIDNALQRVRRKLREA